MPLLGFCCARTLAKGSDLADREAKPICRAAHPSEIIQLSLKMEVRKKGGRVGGERGRVGLGKEGGWGWGKRAGGRVGGKKGGNRSPIPVRSPDRQLTISPTHQLASSSRFCDVRSLG